MKIGLIAMSGVRMKTKDLKELGMTMPQFENRGQTVASLPSLGLLTVAGLTPSEHEVEYLEIDELSPNAEDLKIFDLVGISSLTARINDAYTLADRYRSRGVPVVLGGLHVTMNPDEASLHADSIVVNGAEGAWPKLLEDFEAGEMKEVYRGLRSKVFSEENYVMPRFSLLNGRDYNRLTIQTSRGCPLRCDFCSASIRLTSGFQQKPVALVVEEIKEALKHCDHRFFELSDDNTFVNKKWGKEFLRAIIPLKLTWFCMTDVSIADDEELLDLLAESGCVQILIGFESPDADDLKGINDNDWKRKRAGSYLEIIEKIQSRGITVSGCFVLGLDEQDTTIFKKVRDFVIESKLLEVQLTVLTAFPGTPLYSRLKAEGRLLSEKYWDRCTLFDVNYQPKKMSVQELQDGMLWLYKEVYNETQHTRRKRHYINIIKKRLAAKAKEDDSRNDLSASVPKEQTQTSTVLSRID